MNLLRKAFSFWMSDGRTVERVFICGTGNCDAGASVSDRSALVLSSVRACVNLLAGTVATLPLMICRTLPGNTREPFAGLLLYRILRGNALLTSWQPGIG